MGNNVQVDETSKHASKKLNARRGTVGKPVVVEMCDQDGQVRAQHVPNRRNHALGFVHANAPDGARITIDEAASYVGLECHGYIRAFVYHVANKYVRDQTQTSDMESF